MHVERESSRGAWFIVIFEKPRGVILIVEVSLKVFAHRPGRPGVEAIVETFIVGEIEPVLLQTPFHVPIDFGHEREARMPAANVFDGFGPERTILWRQAVPGA